MRPEMGEVTDAYERLICAVCTEALALATENWQTQKEPADLRILLEAATATRQREPAQQALAWLDRTHLEGRTVARLAALARQL